ncbi:MAG: hypothetical protein CV087_07845 [Candidatus Brocadia sp. WS118]|nr:MAG: hypothetical protein CV087_07845 [Candidatus Brocadia sp. WS118]
MSKTIDAIFENGVFKPITPISISEHKKVTLIIANEYEELSDVILLASRVYDGLSAQEIEDIEKVATDRSHFSRNVN